MSQVIVTDDTLNVKRERTRKQEHEITVDGNLKGWQRTATKKNYPPTVLVGLAAAPVLAIWGFFIACIVIPLKILQAIFKGLGRLVGGTKSLITGK